jgi:hypothetical protein
VDLQSIIDRLEAQNRKLKIAGLCVLAVIGLAMLKGCGGRSPLGGAVVEAQRFIVRGTDGKPRAVLGLIDKDRTYLSLYDSDGKQRAAVGVEDDGPSVKLYNAEGKMQAVLDLLGERPRLMLFDANGHVSHKAP